MQDPLTATLFKEKICKRLMLLQEASGLNKKTFAARIGLTPSQLTNIFGFRNPPPRQAISEAVKEFGVTADFFYTGSRAGMRDPSLPDKLRAASSKLGIDDR